MEIKEMIFRGFCSVENNIMNAGHCVVSSKSIAKCYEITLYKARKMIKELVEDGLLISDMEGGYDEYSCKVYCIRGYRLTEKGRETTEFKQEKWRNSKLMAKCFGGAAYCYYK